MSSSSIHKGNLNRKGKELATFVYRYKEKYISENKKMNLYTNLAMQALYGLRKNYGKLSAKKKNPYIADSFAVWFSGFEFTESDDAELAVNYAIAVYNEFRQSMTPSLQVGETVYKRFDNPRFIIAHLINLEFKRNWRAIEQKYEYYKKLNKKSNKQEDEKDEKVNYEIRIDDSNNSELVDNLEDSENELESNFVIPRKLKEDLKLLPLVKNKREYALKLRIRVNQILAEDFKMKGNLVYSEFYNELIDGLDVIINTI